MAAFGLYIKVTKSGNATFSLYGAGSNGQAIVRTQESDEKTKRPSTDRHLLPRDGR